MSQSPRGYVTEVVFNARVHDLEVRLAVLEGRAHPTSTTDDTTLASMAQQRDAAIREWEAARAATTTALSAHDAVRRERDIAVKERDTARRERGAALQERDTARRERGAALEERDTARWERDAAQATLGLRSAVTPNMVEQYDRIKDRLGRLYQGTQVGEEWKQRQENELDNIQRAFTNNHRLMAGSL
ncbi:uncharacterized protein LAJ45_06868 [Morchella importuna]|uniref:uncharacterized protein n=1 Tax=Morchella importuna TaxID=1174673 RepID=UPI001E8EF0E8|nr:uncharacterized protein LAJ45_06868 [Morchella importuna]KAH8148894.1 hypothetical protein LAJ45_06868 [Morchella importuna]